MTPVVSLLVLMWIVLVFLLSTTAYSDHVHRQLIGGNRACGRARIRRSWDQMSAADRRLYNNAVAESIEQGVFHHFVKVHMDRMSEMEAHDTCGFVLWHRRYILAYENMLRSMGSAFRCVTVPYWDVMTHLKHLVDGQCRNAQDCSAIVTGIGGQPGSSGTRTFNGRRVTNRCYSSSPYASYCDDNEDCGCVPRNDLSSQSIPVGAGFASLFNMISTSRTYSRFTTRLEAGVHQDIHNMVGGLMATFAAPADALFFSWHATIDMLMYIWHECHIANSMTNAEKRTSAYAFNQEEECRLTSDARSNLDSITATTSIGMEIGGRDIRQHADIGIYFRDVGTAYSAFADARSLGDYSYRYAIPADFNRLLGDQRNCPTAPAVTPAPVTPTPTTRAPITAAPRTPSPPDDDDDSVVITPTPDDDDSVVITPTPDDDDESVVIAPTPDDSVSDAPNPSPVKEDGPLTYWEWYDLTKANLEKRHDNPDEVLRQLEYLECLGFDEKFGVQNFTDEFIEAFLQGKPVEPRCLQILESIQKNETRVDTDQENRWGGRARPSKNSTHAPVLKPPLTDSTEAENLNTAPESFSFTLLLGILSIFLFINV